MRVIIEILMAFIGSTCFAMLFNVRKDKLFLAGLGGGLAWAFYLFLGIWIESDVARFVLSSAALTFYAEIMARVKRTPATFFVVSAAIPFFPGSKLYFTMEAAMHGDWSGFADYGTQTLLLAVAIACGILCTMTIVHAWKKRKENWK
ncbi:MAG: threonine/serine exporter family protein [Lachnospiraceae bacterium]|nr:threonine/serine exporter family protein [Lachnospiraceae bacterium]